MELRSTITIIQYRPQFQLTQIRDRWISPADRTHTVHVPPVMAEVLRHTTAEQLAELQRQYRPQFRNWQQLVILCVREVDPNHNSFLPPGKGDYVVTTKCTIPCNFSTQNRSGSRKLNALGMKRFVYCLYIIRMVNCPICT